MCELPVLARNLTKMIIRTLLRILSVASTSCVSSLRHSCIEHDPADKDQVPKRGF